MKIQIIGEILCQNSELVTCDIIAIIIMKSNVKRKSHLFFSVSECVYFVPFFVFSLSFMCKKGILKKQ